MLGELNWIFTAITDTIAWNVLPRGTVLRSLLVGKNFSYFSVHCSWNTFLVGNLWWIL